MCVVCCVYIYILWDTRHHKNLVTGVTRGVFVLFMCLHQTVNGCFFEPKHIVNGGKHKIFGFFQDIISFYVKFPSQKIERNLHHFVAKLKLEGIVHQFVFYRSNLIFWIVMGCGIADFDRRGL